MPNSQDAYAGFQFYNFEEGYSQENNALLTKATDVFSDTIPKAADYFYSQLIVNPEAAKFLSTELVQTRLKAELKAWLANLLSPKNSDAEIQQVMIAQHHVGEVHARINIPMNIVSTAMFFVKHTFFAEVDASEVFSKEEKIRLIILLDTLLMNSLNLINEAYLQDVVNHKRAAVDYQYHTSPKDTALEIVKIKSKLYNWLADYLGVVTSTTPELKTIESESNECGLWITHKLPFLSKNAESVSEIQALQRALQQEVKLRGSTDLLTHVGKIRNVINEINFLLSAISDQILKESEQQDGLTNLISRRYLAPIIQNETHTAMNAKTSYSVVMFDIDDFKAINDQYGHLTGDKVIHEVGRVAKEEIQISDYAFRYGGEEFLLLLPETPLKESVALSERIRQSISRTAIDVGEKEPLYVSCSFGVSEFANHPDYMTVVKAADEKLYESKRNGKNQVCF